MPSRSEYSPVIVGVYDRLDHVRRTVLSLARCELAESTDLFVLSDGPKEGDEKQISKVRRFLHDVRGFKSVTIIERSTNLGRIANNRNGIAEIIRKQQRAIIMEDDNVCAPQFLKFQNYWLERIKHHNTIVAACGYTAPSVVLRKANFSNVLLPRFSAWGYGIWDDRFQELLDTKIKKEHISLRADSAHIFMQYGRDLYSKFRSHFFGNIDALDIRMWYLQATRSYLTVHPKISLVKNIGYDGTGLHSMPSQKFDVQLELQTDYDHRSPAYRLSRSETYEFVKWFEDAANVWDDGVTDKFFAKIDDAGTKCFAIWGTDILTYLFLRDADDRGYTISHFINTWADEDSFFNGQKVLTPEEAMTKDISHIVVLSCKSVDQIISHAKHLGADFKFIYLNEDEFSDKKK